MECECLLPYSLEPATGSRNMQINPFHTVKPHLFKTHFNKLWPSHLCPGFGTVLCPDVIYNFVRNCHLPCTFYSITVPVCNTCPVQLRYVPWCFTLRPVLLQYISCPSTALVVSFCSMCPIFMAYVVLVLPSMSCCSDSFYDSNNIWWKLKFFCFSLSSCLHHSATSA